MLTAITTQAKHIDLALLKKSDAIDLMLSCKDLVIISGVKKSAILVNRKAA
jgi:hypothetical protein